MLVHTFRITLRSLARRKGYALLHVLGLSAGLAACLVIVLYAAHELTYDRFHPDAERIYQARHRIELMEGLVLTSNGIDEQTGALAAGGIVGIERTMRVGWTRGHARAEGRDPLLIGRLRLADERFFDFFGFELLRGDPATVLAGPSDVVLTESMARELFGDADPVGQSFDFESLGFLSSLFGRFTVTGIAADPPANTTVRFDAVARYTPPRTDALGHSGYNLPLYLRLSADADTQSVRRVLQQSARASAPAHRRSDTSATVLLTRLVDADPRPSARLGKEDTRKPRFYYLYLFGSVALGLLAVAVINYVNLATAYAGQRHAEVGVRKTLGASPGGLRVLFWAEAVVLALTAGVTAVLLSLGAPLLFRSFFGFELAVTPFTHPWVGAVVLGIALVVGLVAGAYPALWLARQRPIDALSGASRGGSGGLGLRRVLVVVQFALAVVLVSAAWIMGDQLALEQGRMLGEEDRRTLVLEVSPRRELDRFALLVARVEGVEQVVRSTAAPGAGGYSRTEKPSEVSGVDSATDPTADDDVSVRYVQADSSFLPFYGVEVLAGSGLPGQRGAPVVVLSRTAARQLGFGATPEEAVGKTWRAGPDERTVVGVVRDFSMGTFDQDNRAAALFPLPTEASASPSQQIGALSVRIGGGALEGALGGLEAAWREVFTDRPFEYTFLDEVFAEMFEAERRTQSVFGFASVLTLALAGIGLFGLAAFAAEQRRREIGVRKVLGASVAQTIALLSRDFVALVLAGLVLAIPLAYLLMHVWLASFAERAPIRPGVFVLSGALVLTIALATVGYNAWRAASSNPADVLRDE
jgi:putative ABC transport system permease protein